jgi:hypothetical protein
MISHSGEVEAPQLLPLLTPPRPKAQLDRRNRDQSSLLGLFSRIQQGARERRTFRERRAGGRVEVELECEEREGQARLVRLTHDLSTFGMSMRLGHTPQVGTVLALRLYLPDEPSAPLPLQATVLGPFDAEGGLRLRFVSPTAEAARRIHRYLQSLPATR